MRLIIYSMFGLLIAIQYPLWLGKGGWFKVYEMEKQLKDQKELNQALEHGMLKEGEYFVQILPSDKSVAEAKQDALAKEAQKPQ